MIINPKATPNSIQVRSFSYAISLLSSLFSVVNFLSFLSDASSMPYISESSASIFELNGGREEGGVLI